MNINGTITNTQKLSGNAVVARCQYDNVNNIIDFVIQWTVSAQQPTFTRHRMSGADVTALGANWGDTDLLNWLVTKYGLTNLDAAQTASAPTGQTAATGAASTTSTQTQGT